MSDYPPRVTKSEAMYALWENGEGDMSELAIGLYDLTAHYKALWDEHEALEAELAEKSDEVQGLRKLAHDYIEAYEKLAFAEQEQE